MLALTGTTGKIGGAVLNALLAENLIPPNQLVLCTSSSVSDSRWDKLKSQGVQIRYSNYNEAESMSKAFSGCTKLFLVSTPRIEMDFNDAAYGEGREKHHFAAIEAAQKAGVQHIYYTSLAFGGTSKAGVMRAHLRTEAVLQEMKETKFTIIREGLYNESWPLYLGYYDLKVDERKEIVLAGDGPVSWTAIADLGLGTGLVVVDESTKYVGKTIYLSAPKTKSLKDIAKIVSGVKGGELEISVVPRAEYVDYYTSRGRDRPAVEWWSSSYAALQEGECDISDATMARLFADRSRTFKPIEETIREMLGG